MNSAEELIAATRAALTAAGLERRELDGSVYFTGGAGPTLVLIHGANDHAGTWAPLVPLLSQYRLIVPDLAGHGESAPASGPIPMPMIVDRLHAVLSASAAALGSSVGAAALGSAGAPEGGRAHTPEDGRAHTRFTLVGNSMGAWIALLYVLMYPERVERLVLESGGGLARPPAVPLTASNREEAMLILRAVHGPEARLPDWSVDALLRRAADAPMLRLTDLQFVDGRLGDVHAPTTLVWGEHDGVVPRAYAEELRDAIRGARLEIVEGAAHIPHAQQPARFAACLTATS